jgi:hypothetical protein
MKRDSWQLPEETRERFFRTQPLLDAHMIIDDIKRHNSRKMEESAAVESSITGLKKLKEEIQGLLKKENALKKTGGQFEDLQKDNIHSQDGPSRLSNAFHEIKDILEGPYRQPI